MNIKLGARVKQLREKKNLTLKKVAKKSGLSISFISQLEHNKTSATLESFKKISEALDVSPSYFFSKRKAADEFQAVVVQGSANELEFKESSFIYKDLIGATEQPLFLPILVTLNPGDNRGNNFTHQGQEFLYVVKGVLTVFLNDQEFTLQTNDSIFLDSSKPHYWQNNTDEPIMFLCVYAEK